MNRVAELQIGQYHIGGLFGAHPALLVGSIFYDRHALLRDALAGEFDQDRAAALLSETEHLAELYGLQLAIDVIASTPEAMERQLTFTAARTRLPLIVNATDAESRIAGLEAAARMEILDRCVYASLTEDVEESEVEALRLNRPAAVMALAADITNPTPEGTVALVKDFFQPILEDTGVVTPLVDVGAMDPPSVGLSIRSIEAVRRECGYPAGCAFSNSFSQWPGLAELGQEFLHLSLAAAAVAVRSAGGDFLHYGLIERALPVAHATATAEVFFGFAAQELDSVRLPRQHPLRSMFRLSDSRAD